MNTPNTAARMIAIRRIDTGMDTGRELLNWYISDPGDVGIFDAHANTFRKTHNSMYDIIARLHQGIAMPENQKQMRKVKKVSCYNRILFTLKHNFHVIVTHKLIML